MVTDGFIPAHGGLRERMTLARLHCRGKGPSGVS